MLAHYPLRLGLDVLLASSNGATADEVRRGLNVSQSKYPGPIVREKIPRDTFLNMSYVGAYISSKLNPREEYLTKIQRMGAEVVRSEDFTFNHLLRKLVNIAAAPHLNFRLLPDIPRGRNQTNEVFLIAAGSFRGAFSDAGFEKENRQMIPFNVDERRRTLVETMYSPTRKRQVAQLPKLRSRMLLLPFENSRVRFMILLPDQINGLFQLEKALEFVDLRSLLAEQFDKRHYDISLPVISMETVIYLGDKLQGIGIKKAFHSSEADLSQITGSRNPWVARFLHTTKLKLAEGGINFQQLPGEFPHIIFIWFNTYISPFADVTLVRHDEGPGSAHFFASHPFFFALLDDDNIYATGRYGFIEGRWDDE